MARPGVLGQLHVFPRPTQTLDVVATRLDGNVIIRSPVKDPNRSITHLLVIDVCRVTRGVKWDVGSKLDASWPMHPPEAIQAGIERRKSSFGKAHYRDPWGVDSCVLRE